MSTMKAHFRGIGMPIVRMILTVMLLTRPLSGAAAAEYSPSANEDFGVTSDLAAMLQNTPVHQQELFSHALRIIHSMESSPTCNRLAALTLINSCQSLEQVPSDTKVKADSEMILDEVKSEYAARLAVCELSGAKAGVPKDCQILVPSSRACVKYRFSSLFGRQDTRGELCYLDATHAQFERCLKALESKPQWWTSYSNARQNAVVMCQASRDAIEREEKLSFYKSLAEVTTDMTSALANSIKEAQRRLGEQMEFIEKIRKSQLQAMEEIRTSREATLSTLDHVVTDLRSAFQSLKNMVSQAWMSADGQVQGLNESLNKTKASMDETREEMLYLFKEFALASQQHTATQNHQLQLNHETALAVQQALDMVRNGHLHTLSEAIAALRGEVQGSSRLMEEMYERQTHLDQRLASLNGTFESLETTAGNLQTTIDATTSTIQMLTFFSGMGGLVIWGGSVLFLTGLWFASRRVAGYFMTFTGLSCILYAVSIQGWLQIAVTHTGDLRLMSLRPFIAPIINQTSGVYIFIEFIACCIISALIYSWIDATYLYKYEDDKGEKGILPRIETPESPATPPPQNRHRFNPFTAFRSFR